LLKLIYKTFLKTYTVCVRKPLRNHTKQNFVIQFWLRTGQ